MKLLIQLLLITIGSFVLIVGTAVNLEVGNYGWAVIDILIGSWSIYLGRWGLN